MKMQMFTSIVVCLLALNKVVAEPIPSTNPQLNILSASTQRLEADYSTETGLGIRILSEVSKDGETVMLLIKSASGETVFEFNRPSSHADTHLSLNGEEFLLLNRSLDNGETAVSVYHIPPAYSRPVQAAIQRHHRVSDRLLRRLKSKTALATGQSAVNGLFKRAEMQLIPEAAVALGSHVTGYDNPAAMAFYSTALRFSAVLQSDLQTSKSDTESLTVGHKQRDRRWGWLSPSNWFRADEYCSNSRSTCTRGTCPQGDNCSGLCGPGCECWWWTCGDCCYNVGCAAHDTSAGCLDDVHSVECIASAPIAFICS